MRFPCGYVERVLPRWHGDPPKKLRLGTIWWQNGEYYLYRKFDWDALRFRKTDSLALDLIALQQLRDKYGMRFMIYQNDMHGRIWSAPIGYFFAYGILADFGAAPQLFLGLEFWNMKPAEA